ncbi:Putative defense protein [Geodia barretti]|uniref:Defense protein n=1 Tax=Geodia barretti TaxID=519541 RepID=A0AA35W3Y9_GEOBA|nr:Putative defense protein [Geodia barretti]
MSLAASVLVLLLACLYAADARSGGAPAAACGTLMPDLPGHTANGQTDPVPYEIDLTVFDEDENGTLQYTPGGVYTLTFRRMGDVTFRGFLVRARLAADNSFLTNAPFAMIASQTNTRISSCEPANSGITHSNGQSPRVELTEVRFQWTAPPADTGPIFFGFAVVRTQQVYWAAQMSAMLEEGPAPTATPTTPAEPSATPIPTVVTPEPSTTPGPETTAPTEETPSVATVPPAVPSSSPTTPDNATTEPEGTESTASASGVLFSGLSILLAMLATLLL